MASSMAWAVGSFGSALLRYVCSVDLVSVGEVVSLPGTEPEPEPLSCDWCCASRSAEISRESLLTCDSDSASRAFSSSIFSSRSW